jgi:hypothetical protein
MSWKESTHEGSCLGEKTRQIFSTFSLFSSVFARAIDVAPDVGFRRSWYPYKVGDTLFLKFVDLQEVELGLERYGPMNRGSRSVFSSSEGRFPIEIPAKPGMILAIRELHIVSECFFFIKVLDLRIKSLWVGKNLFAKATLPGGKL